MKYSIGWISLLSVTVMLACACGPRKMVYIPPEWRTPPPPVAHAPASPAPPRAKASAPPSSAEKAPVLKPPPAFTEKDLPSGPEPGEPAPEIKKPAPPPPPQHMASMHLVDQGKAALAQGKADAAISVLEQAIQVDVQNGEAFLELARAWRMKASRNKAVEFARKAEVLFHEEKEKLKEVYRFQSELYKEMGDSARAEQYRKKAASL